jgi:Polyketide cyclase / dehydrase and lipid transport
MQSRKLLLTLFTLSTLLLPLQAAALRLLAKADVDRSMLTGKVDIVAYVDVPADVPAAWAVLTDYNKLAEFVPDMDTSRIVSKPGEAIKVYQRGKKSWLLIDMPLELVFNMHETPPSSIRFSLVSGNIGDMYGEWRLYAFGQGVRIKYVAHMKPGLFSPRVPGDSLLIESDIENMMQAIGQEILRRKQLTTRP